jgi:hypothetical protein
MRLEVIPFDTHGVLGLRPRPNRLWRDARAVNTAMTRSAPTPASREEGGWWLASKRRRPAERRRANVLFRKHARTTLRGLRGAHGSYNLCLHNFTNKIGSPQCCTLEYFCTIRRWKVEIHLIYLSHQQKRVLLTFLVSQYVSYFH